MQPPKVPEFGPLPGLTAFLNDFTRYVTEFGRTKMSSTIANEQLLLYGPDKSVYKVYINASGVLITEKIG